MVLKQDIKPEILTTQREYGLRRYRQGNKVYEIYEGDRRKKIKCDMCNK